MATERYFNPHQARVRPSTQFEDLLGDAIERAFGSGITELPALIDYLNKSGPMGPNGQPWTIQSYEKIIPTLGK